MFSVLGCVKFDGAFSCSRLNLLHYKMDMYSFGICFQEICCCPLLFDRLLPFYFNLHYTEAKNVARASLVMVGSEFPAALDMNLMRYLRVSLAILKIAAYVEAYRNCCQQFIIVVQVLGRCKKKKKKEA